MTATAQAPAEPADPTASFLDRPLTSLHLILVCTGLLLGLGLVMVLSASMVKSYQETGSAYSVFTGQAIWVALAVPVFWLGVRLTPRAYRRSSYPLLLLSLVLLAAVLVPGVGLNLNGAQRWLDLGPSRCSRPSWPSSRSCSGAPTCWSARSGCSATPGT